MKRYRKKQYAEWMRYYMKKGKQQKTLPYFLALINLLHRWRKETAGNTTLYSEDEGLINGELTFTTRYLIRVDCEEITSRYNYTFDGHSLNFTLPNAWINSIKKVFPNIKTIRVFYDPRHKNIMICEAKTYVIYHRIPIYVFFYTLGQ